MTRRKILLNGIWLAIYTYGIFLLGQFFMINRITTMLGDDEIFNEAGTSGMQIGNGEGIIGIILLVAAITLRIPEIYHYFKKKIL